MNKNSIECVMMKVYFTRKQEDILIKFMNKHKIEFEVIDSIGFEQ